MLLTNTQEAPQCIKERFKRIFSVGMINSIFTIAQKLCLNISIFKYAFDFKWNPIDVIKYGSDLSCVNILLPPKESCMDLDEEIRILYSKEDCIVSIFDDIESNPVSINILNSLKTTWEDEKLTDFLLDYALDSFTIDVEPNIKKMVANFAMSSGIPKGRIGETEYKKVSIII
jgi:hypothetical protein